MVVLNTSCVENGLENFFQQIEEIEEDIEKVTKLLKILQEANEKSKFTVKASLLKGIQKRMEKDIDEVKNIALAAKSKLEDLEKENINNRSKPGCGKGSSVDRTRATATMALKKNWKEKVFEFQSLRENIKQEYRDVVDRTVFTVTGSRINVEVIDQLIEMGISGQIYEKVIQEQGRGQVIETLAEIQNRHETLNQIEKQLLELQQIFLDMFVLVEVQGEMLDNIESQVAVAVENIMVGTNSLQKAKNMQKTRTWIWIAIIVFLLVAIGIVVAVVKPWTGL